MKIGLDFYLFCFLYVWAFENWKLPSLDYFSMLYIFLLFLIFPLWFQILLNEAVIFLYYLITEMCF